MLEMNFCVLCYAMLLAYYALIVFLQIWITGYVKSVYKLEQFLQDYDDNLFTKTFRKTCHASSASQSQVYLL